jgi:hypothetical protein
VGPNENTTIPMVVKCCFKVFKPEFSSFVDNTTTVVGTQLGNWPLSKIELEPKSRHI